MTGPDKGRPRRLSQDEHTLWRGVTRSIAPLKRQAHWHLAEMLDAGLAERKAKAVPTKRPQAGPSGPSPARHDPPVAKSPTSARPQPHSVFDRRLKQRLARGTEEIAARIDLHGRTQMEAHAALLGFLDRAQSSGAKTVLVITGKGGRSGTAGEGGILKRQVPQWLALPAFRVYVAGTEDAHFVHGGQGALYVRLRRARA